MISTAPPKLLTMFDSSLLMSLMLLLVCMVLDLLLCSMSSMILSLNARISVAVLYSLIWDSMVEPMLSTTSTRYFSSASLNLFPTWYTKNTIAKMFRIIMMILSRVQTLVTILFFFCFWFMGWSSEFSIIL